MEQQLLGYEDTLYRLDEAEHIAGRLDRLHDWPLASALIERWRLESYTFHPPCGEMTITLQDVAYQLRLRIDGDPVGGCIEDKQSQTKWTVKLTWFHNTVCSELEQDTTEERLMRYTRGYIMQLIGGILFPDASDSRVYIRWLSLLVDLNTYGWLSWGSAVLAWLYRQMWIQYWPDNARGESRLRHYRCTLNGIGMLNVDWMSYANPQLIGKVPPAIAEAEALAALVCLLLCFAIIEWHQVDGVVRQFGGLQHILTRPLNIDEMHRLDGRFGRDEWFP
ncbi:uncharacterized protein DS421_11g336230 [Arachis hypogaea]|nr:uncharacterized protein DS421_11g336230 [Arachis hypogaea]